MSNSAKPLLIVSGNDSWVWRLVEPIDDFQDIYPPSNEPLMEFLSEEIVRNDFDLKEFMRMIFCKDLSRSKRLRSIQWR